MYGPDNQQHKPHGWYNQQQKPLDWPNQQQKPHGWYNQQLIQQPTENIMVDLKIPHLIFTITMNINAPYS